MSNETVKKISKFPYSDIEFLRLCEMIEENPDDVIIEFKKIFVNDNRDILKKDIKYGKTRSIPLFKAKIRKYRLTSSGKDKVLKMVTNKRIRLGD